MGSAGVDVDLDGSLSVSFGSSLGVGLSGIPTAYTITIPKLTVGLDPISADVTVRLREIPSIRTHIPANFTLGLSLLGYELACLRLCGEAQVITEPYDPNPCEECGGRHRPGIEHEVPVERAPVEVRAADDWHS